MQCVTTVFGLIIFYFVAKNVFLFDVWSVWHAWLLKKGLIVRQADVSKVLRETISNPCYQTACAIKFAADNF